MSGRKSIGKKLRFEVFKRDCFKCQYCGRTAPEVVLQVDHIDPVAAGGTNEILNLVTACCDCNSGKSNRRLDDRSVVERQRAQLEALQERKEQLEMMMQWHRALSSEHSDAAHMVSERWRELAPGWVCSADGRRSLEKWIKKYGVAEVLESMDIAADAKLEFLEDGTATRESWVEAFDYIRRVLAVRSADRENPNLRNVMYTIGILKRRFRYVNTQRARRYLEDAFAAGATFERLKSIACSERNWTNWESEMLDLMGVLDEA